MVHRTRNKFRDSQLTLSPTLTDDRDCLYCLAYKVVYHLLYFLYFLIWKKKNFASILTVQDEAVARSFFLLESVLVNFFFFDNVVSLSKKNDDCNKFRMNGKRKWK